MSIQTDGGSNGVADHFAVIGFPDHGLSNEDIKLIVEEEAEVLTTTLSQPTMMNNKFLSSIHFDPRVIDQYPLADNKSCSSKLPEGIEYFCFPQGLQLYEKSCSPTFHSFVHTSEDGTRMIGCTLNFWEELLTGQYQSINLLIEQLNETYHLSIQRPTKLYTKKGICLLSRYAFINSFKIFLLSIFKMTKSLKNLIPLERYICNFIDDIPAPPPGKVDIKYFIGDETILFTCPPLNQPNNWFGYSIFPLFECLSAENIIYLLTLALTERQILFISSQYHLLTICAESISSLMYPFRWAHAYIPVLPTRLLGALGAPFPFIFGIHHETYKNNTHLIGNETVKIFLDDNVIAFGALGLPPPIPEGRYKKLFNHIIEAIPWFRFMMQTTTTAVTTAALNSANNHYQHHLADSQLFQSEYWKKFRLPLFDDAYSKVCMEPMELGNVGRVAPSAFPSSSEIIETPNFSVTTSLDEKIFTEEAQSECGNIQADDSNRSSIDPSAIGNSLSGQSMVDDQQLRSGFLKFFVTMLKDYKKYLIYPRISPSNGRLRAVLVEDRFKFEQFIKDQPSDWQPLLRTLVYTQTFSQFVDDRVLFNKLDKDVIFFDESIDAKMNRYTFRWGNIDTPFLLYNQDRHIKTYVPPSPSLSQLPPERNYLYNRFPTLNPSLFIPNRRLAACFSGSSDRLLSILSKVRLKRKHGNQGGGGRSNNQGVNVTNSGSMEFQQLSGAACTFSTHLVVMCQFISYSIDQLRGSSKQQRFHIPSTKQLMDEYSNTSDSTHGDGAARVRANSVYSFYVNCPSSPSQKPVSDHAASKTAPFHGIPHYPSSQHNSGTLVTLSHVKSVVSSAKLALKVVFELLNSLIRMDYLPDEIVYRSLSEACADLKESDRLIDLIVFLDEEGFVPAHHIRHALIRSMNFQQDYSTITAEFDSAKCESLPTNYDHLDSMEESTKLYDSNLALSFILAQLSTSASPDSPPNQRRFNSIAEIWSFTNWASLRRDGSTVTSRSLVPPQVGGSPRFYDSTESKLASLFFGGNSSNSSAGSSSLSSQSQPPQSLSFPSSPPSSTSPSVNQELSQVSRYAPQRTSYGGAVSLAKERWTSKNILEGTIPHLPWNQREIELMSLQPFSSDSSLIPASSSKTAASSGNGGKSGRVRYKCFAASPRLFRQVKIGEDWLMKVIPHVTIDLLTSPGMKCTGNACPIERPLTLQEIYTGWMEIPAPDRSNQYTAKCIYCNHEFLPRFCVQHVPSDIKDTEVSSSNHPTPHSGSDNDSQRDTVLSSASLSYAPFPKIDVHQVPYLSLSATVARGDADNNRSSLPLSSSSSSAVWCELLSPWTLYKEILTVLFEEGVQQLLSQQFKSRGHQSEVLFWNAILSFRLRGLPIAFLLTNRNIVDAFPPTLTTNSASSSSQS